MSKRTQTYILGALLVILVIAYFSSRNQTAVLPGVLAADMKYQPMNIEDPALRLDLLDKIHKQEYEGRHRDIFSAARLLSPPRKRGKSKRAAKRSRCPPVRRPSTSRPRSTATP